MLRFVYLVYICFVFLPIFFVLTILTALTTTLGCLLGGDKFFSYYPGMIWSKVACYLALCPVKIKGREHINRKKSYVFIANHQGAFDIFLIYGFLGVPIKWVMKASLGKIPFVGKACRAAGFIFVDNSSRKAAAKTIKDAEHALRNGASIAIFPEGSRTHDGKVGRFKKAAYQMAVDQSLSVIPITLNGPFKVLPSGSFNMSRHRMEMIIHEPISTNGIDTSIKGLQEKSDEAREVIISSLWDEFK